jgi:amino-acid N-acetyltransferase
LIDIKVEKAKIGDVPQIHRLVNYFAAKGDMLARPLSELYENIRDFFVVREGQEVIACCSLHVTWADLAEVKAMAVKENYQRQGVGSNLVKACKKEAVDLDIPILFTLTYRPEFFGKHQFIEVDKMQLPKKVWTECYHCPKFPDCDEIAMYIPLKEGAKLG